MMHSRLDTFIIVLVALLAVIGTASAGTGDLQVLEPDTVGIDEASGSACPGCTPPTAAFRADTTSGSAPFTAQFHDMSIGTIVDRYWDFTNDGSIDSTTWNPTFTYTQPGTYTVRLIAVGCGGADIEVKTDYITVLPGATLSLVAPNGGETWEQGSTHTITWRYTYNPGDITIEVLKGSTSLGTIPNVPVGDAGQGSYDLTLPYSVPVGSDYRIRIASSNYPALNDVSDAPFTISADSTTSIALASPNGEESYSLGSVLPFSWTYTGNPGPTVNIEVLKGTLVLKVLPAIPVGSEGSGSYSLTIPYSTPLGNDYRVRVTSTSYPAYTDTSDKSFTITAPTITITAPDNGDTWQQGSTQSIQWDYTGNPGPTVKIEAIKGSAVRVIAASAPLGSGGSGSFTLTIPPTIPSGSDYQIRVTSTSYPACADTSDGTFEIGNPT